MRFQPRQSAAPRFDGISSVFAVSASQQGVSMQVEVEATTPGTTPRTEPASGPLVGTVTQQGIRIGRGSRGAYQTNDFRTYEFFIPAVPGQEEVPSDPSPDPTAPITVELELRDNGSTVDTATVTTSAPPQTPAPPENGNGGNGGQDQGVSTEGLLIGAAGLGYLLFG